MSMITIITAIATAMRAMATDAANERQQLRNAACCNCIRSGRARTSRGHEISTMRYAVVIAAAASYNRAAHFSTLWPPQPFSVNDTAGRAHALQEAGDREVASVQRFFEVTLLKSTPAAFVVVGANNIRTISSAIRRLLTSVLSLGHPKVSRGVAVVAARSQGLQLLSRVSVALVFVLFNVFGSSTMCAMAQAFQDRFNTRASFCISRRSLNAAPVAACTPTYKCSLYTSPPSKTSLLC
jgi:hypothetical protein